MNNHLNMLINPHYPWFVFKKDKICDGILCELNHYLSKSLNYSYSFYMDNNKLYNFYENFKVSNKIV